MEYSLLIAAPVIGMIAMTASSYWGIGCGWLVVPGLMVAGADGPSAVAVSLLQIFPASIATVWREAPEVGWRRGGYGRRIALPLCGASMVFALSGEHINHWLIQTFDSQKPLQLLLALSMVYVLMNIFKKPLPENEENCPLFHFRDSLVASGGGAAIGLISSTLGIGGGILIRPLLRRHFRIPPLETGRITRQLLIGSTTVAGLTYLFGAAGIDWNVLKVAVLMAIGGAVGFPIGGKLYQEVSKAGHGHLVTRSYALIAAIVTLTLIFKLLDWHRLAFCTLAGGAGLLVIYFIVMHLWCRNSGTAVPIK